MEQVFQDSPVINKEKCLKTEKLQFGKQLGWDLTS